MKYPMAISAAIVTTAARSSGPARCVSPNLPALRRGAFLLVLLSCLWWGAPAVQAAATTADE